MEAILAAAVTASGAAAVAWVQTRKARRSTDNLRADIATNHGMRPGEYLEQIHAEVADIRSLVVLSAQEQARVAAELAAHTIADTDNFGELRRLLIQREQGGTDAS